MRNHYPRTLYCSHRCKLLVRNARINRPCKDCGKTAYNRLVRCRDCKKAAKPFEQLTHNGERRKRMIKELGHRCQMCGLTEWLGQLIPLETDHIDGDHSNRTRSNFRLLCPNCHVFTPTYKWKNGQRKYKNAVEAHLDVHPLGKREVVSSNLIGGSKEIG